MNDTKNILLAWASTLSPMLSLIEGSMLINIVSAVVLPVVFFAAGKTIDVLIQLQLRRREEKRREQSEGKAL